MKRASSLKVAFLYVSIYIACLAIILPARSEIEPNKDFIEKVWKEEAIKLPAYPLDKNLIEFKIHSSAYQYFIDQVSLSVGKKDQVARYTLVIQTPNGTRNAFHEGIQCNTGEVKTYAYGVVSISKVAEFKAMPQPEWRIIDQETGVYAYRVHLKDIYLCESKVVRFKVRDIIQTLKYPPAS